MTDERRRRGEQPAARPAELKPMQLKNDPAREIAHSPLVSRDTPAVRPADRSARMTSIEASTFTVQPTKELRPELKREIERGIALQDIPVTNMQMLELRERRVEARDLGWKVPGKRIRIEPNT